MSRPDGPLEAFSVEQGFVVLDGGLATELEAQGQDLADPLWSAKVLLEAPEAIRAVHRSYLEAGADVIATVTYQASFEGFEARGIEEAAAVDLFRLAVGLAVEARDRFWSDAPHRARRLEPRVAASFGPYGAFLADGSEYRGDYRLAPAELRAFHRRRWEAVFGPDAGSGPDLTAWETIPSAREALVLRDLLAEHPERYAWISFSCRDERRISDGTPIAEVAAELDGTPNLVGIGVNCTPPGFMAGLAEEVRGVSSTPIFLYPNSGGRYDAERKAWETPPTRVDWGRAVPIWRSRGTFGFGGCCRVGPSDIAAIRSVLETT